MPISFKYHISLQNCFVIHWPSHSEHVIYSIHNLLPQTPIPCSLFSIRLKYLCLGRSLNFSIAAHLLVVVLLVTLSTFNLPSLCLFFWWDFLHLSSHYVKTSSECSDQLGFSKLLLFPYLCLICWFQILSSSYQVNPLFFSFLIVYVSRLKIDELKMLSTIKNWATICTLLLFISHHYNYSPITTHFNFGLTSLPSHSLTCRALWRWKTWCFGQKGHPITPSQS